MSGWKVLELAQMDAMQNECADVGVANPNGTLHSVNCYCRR